MRKSFLETRAFTKWVVENLSDEEYAEIQRSLMENAEAGTPIRGCGGLRKLRIPLARRGKGKRGGARIVYLHVPEADWIFLVDAYSKDETEDLTGSQRKILKQLAEQLKRAAATAQDRGHK